MALVIEPKTLRANSRFTTATCGACLSSCHVKALPDSKAVRAALNEVEALPHSHDLADVRNGSLGTHWEIVGALLKRKVYYEASLPAGVTAWPVRLLGRRKD